MGDKLTAQPSLRVVPPAYEQQLRPSPRRARGSRTVCLLSVSLLEKGEGVLAALPWWECYRSGIADPGTNE